MLFACLFSLDKLHEKLKQRHILVARERTAPDMDLGNLMTVRQVVQSWSFNEDFWRGRERVSGGWGIWKLGVWEEYGLYILFFCL